MSETSTNPEILRQEGYAKVAMRRLLAEVECAEAETNLVAKTEHLSKIIDLARDAFGCHYFLACAERTFREQQS